MADLFTPGANPDLPLPAYGDLSPMQEGQLYAADKPRWRAYVAQGYAQRYRGGGIGRRAFLMQWGTVLSKELREAIWTLLSATERDEIRQIVEASKEPVK